MMEKLNSADLSAMSGKARDDEAARMAQVEPVMLDGKNWYRLSEVCRAMRITTQQGSREATAAHRRKQFEHRRGYRSITYMLVDREGVNLIVTRYCRGAARGEIMRVLK